MFVSPHTRKYMKAVGLSALELSWNRGQVYDHKKNLWLGGTPWDTHF
jgi:hypothetical protein